MRFLVAVFVLLTVAAAGRADDQTGVLKPVRRDAPFLAYWLMAKEAGNRADYPLLLVTHGPLEDLAGHQAWSHHPFDNMAMTFRSYRRNSLWDAPFLCVKRFGAIDTTSKTAVVDGSTYLYEACPLQDVVKLLEKPLGTLPISRRVDPLEGAEQTAKAFQLLLKLQLQDRAAPN